MNSKAWSLEDQKNFDRWEKWGEKLMQYNDRKYDSLAIIGAIVSSVDMELTEEETEHDRMIEIKAIVSAYKQKYL